MRSETGVIPAVGVKTPKVWKIRILQFLVIFTLSKNSKDWKILSPEQCRRLRIFLYFIIIGIGSIYA